MSDFFKNLIDAFHQLDNNIVIHQIWDHNIVFEKQTVFLLLKLKCRSLTHFWKGFCDCYYMLNLSPQTKTTTYAVDALC